jgi:hypothetical protein
MSPFARHYKALAWAASQRRQSARRATAAGLTHFACRVQDMRQTGSGRGTMARDIQIAVDAGVIRVTYRGDVEYEATTQMLREVGRLAPQRQGDRLLFDIRQANYRDYHLGALRHSEEGPSLGIDHGFRIAFLGAPDHPLLGYLEAVSVNRGYWAKAFTDEAQAEGWLRSAT